MLTFLGNCDVIVSFGLPGCFSNFSSALGPIFKFLSILCHNFFHLSVNSRTTKCGIVSALGCIKGDFVSALSSILSAVPL